MHNVSSVLIQMLSIYTNVAFETDESVLNSEVSSIQVCIIDRLHSIPCSCLFHSMLVLSMQVWGVAMFGGNLLLLCGGVLGMVIGVSFGVRMRVCVAVVACLSLSSAPLARQFIDSESCTYVYTYIQ